MLIKSHDSYPYRPDAPVWGWLKDSANIEIRGVQPPGKYADALPDVLASGDVPDIVFFNHWDEANRYGSQGFFLDLTQYLHKLPNLKAFWAANPANRQMSETVDKSNYMFTFGNVIDQRGWLVRNDVLSRYGLQPPRTWDELYMVLKRLKEVYPDSYPFAFRYGVGILDLIAPSFSSGGSIYADAEGQMHYGPIEPGFRALVEYMARFYAEGLIPPHFMSMSNKEWEDTLAAGQAFITSDYVVRIDYFQNLTNGVSFDLMAPPAGPGGKQEVMNGNFATTGMGISARTPRLATALKYVDFLFSEEGIHLTNWGKEGESYTSVNGAKHYKISDAFQLRKETNLLTSGTYAVFRFDAYNAQYSEKQQLANRVALQYNHPIKPILPPLTYDEQILVATTFERIRKTTNDYLAQFIMGRLPLTEWDRYVQEIEKLGLNPILEMYTNAWQRSKHPS
ncbi:extracellular solute-binding protein [Paenibacillus koleovorans]|uniref:extracellular solute-binding protein n=1 Tax=Paenibacillus koleovorans TaxID=121608 RepID=UPI0013E2FE36|nr:extracellular solute-binding protein [Paenibacillus koleovorans]